MSQAEPASSSWSSSRRCRATLRIVARLIALGTAAVSAYAILQVQDLLTQEPTLSSTNTSTSTSTSTLTMPVLLCMPSAVQMPGVNGTTSIVHHNYDNDNNNNNVEDEQDPCRSLRFMAQAAMCALGLATTAIVLFVLMDVISRAGWGPFTQSSVLGMALFSVFILFQAAYSTGAIVQEVRHWQDYYDELLRVQQEQANEVDAVRDNANSTTTTTTTTTMTGWTVAVDNKVVEISDIDVYGDTFILILAVGALFLTTLLMLTEVMTSLLCCGGKNNNSNRARDHATTPELQDLEVKPTQSLSLLDSPSLTDQETPTSSSSNAAGNLSVYMGSSALSSATSTTPSAPADMSQPPSWSNYGSNTSLY